MKTVMLSLAIAVLLVSSGCAMEMDLTDEDFDSETEELAQCGHFINALVTKRGATTSKLYLRVDALFVECRASVVQWRVKRTGTSTVVASGAGSTLPANFTVSGLLPGRNYCYTAILTSSSGVGLTEDFCFDTADAPIGLPPGGIGGWY